MNEDFEYDEVGRLREEIKGIREWQDNESLKAINKEITTKQNHFNKQIANTDAKLEKEGYPGFINLTGAVTAELQKRVADDPDDIRLDQPSGWEKIYKEIYPSLQAKFTGREPSDNTTTTKTVEEDIEEEVIEEPTERETWGLSDYVKMRQESQL